MKRYSEKRQAILECLVNTKTHPTAEWIYESLKPEYPRLSIATVYRNLAEMKKEGIIRSVGIVDGFERLDGTTAPHTHAVCSVCGKVIDVMDAPLPHELCESVEKLTGYKIERADLRFLGICEECRKKGVKE